MSFPLHKFIVEFWSAPFVGDLKLWSGNTKKTNSYGPGDIPRLVEEVERRKSSEDLYIGLSTQPADLGSTSRGSNDTALMLPGVFLDIDFANAKDSAKRYPPDAETALKVLRSSDHQPFLIQNSGNGLHAVLKFDRPLVIRNREDRRKAQAILRLVGRRLAKHFERAGYEIDSVFDLARVFRVPGTFNHKSGTPKPVTVIEYNRENQLRLADLEEALPSSEEEARTATVGGRADHAIIQKECGWYGHYTGDGAATADEPNWYGAASITARSKDGERIFHEYSARHPKYDVREADKKLQRALEEAGPRTCETIAAEPGNERFCDGCPHRGTITSPIQLGVGYDPGPNGPRPLGFTKEGSYACSIRCARSSCWPRRSNCYRNSICWGWLNPCSGRGGFPAQKLARPITGLPEKP